MLFFDYVLKIMPKKSDGCIFFPVLQTDVKYQDNE